MEKVMVSLIALATLGLGAAVSLPAHAAQPMNQPTRVSLQSPQRHEYRVQYHRRNQQKWVNAGTFRDRAAAQKEVNKLDHQGYVARIVTL